MPTYPNRESYQQPRSASSFQTEPTLPTPNRQATPLRGFETTGFFINRQISLITSGPTQPSDVDRSSVICHACQNLPLRAGTAPNSRQEIQRKIDATWDSFDRQTVCSTARILECLTYRYTVCTVVFSACHLMVHII
jgi:hypothetical protein